MIINTCLSWVHSICLQIDNRTRPGINWATCLRFCPRNSSLLHQNSLCTYAFDISSLDLLHIAAALVAILQQTPRRPKRLNYRVKESKETRTSIEIELSVEWNNRMKLWIAPPLWACPLISRVRLWGPRRSHLNECAHVCSWWFPQMRWNDGRDYLNQL